MVVVGSVLHAVSVNIKTEFDDDLPGSELIGANGLPALGDCGTLEGLSVENISQGEWPLGMAAFPVESDIGKVLRGKAMVTKMHILVVAGKRDSISDEEESL